LGSFSGTTKEQGNDPKGKVKLTPPIDTSVQILIELDGKKGREKKQRKSPSTTCGGSTSPVALFIEITLRRLMTRTHRKGSIEYLFSNHLANFFPISKDHDVWKLGGKNAR